MVKAVIFDLDDTLISEKQYIISGYREIAKYLSENTGLPEEHIFNELNLLLAKNSKNVFNRLLDKIEIDHADGMVGELVGIYRNHFPNIALYEDARLCLERLKRTGIRTGIITDGYVTGQRQKLKAVKADEYVDEIIITDEWGIEFRKPHPRAFEWMKNKLHIEFEEMIYIGDNPQKDFYIRKIHPLQTVRIYRDGVYLDQKYLEDIREMYSIRDFSELDAIIGSQTGEQAK